MENHFFNMKSNRRFDRQAIQEFMVMYKDYIELCNDIFNPKAKLSKDDVKMLFERIKTTLIAKYDISPSVILMVLRMRYKDPYYNNDLAHQLSEMVKKEYHIKQKGFMDDDITDEDIQERIRSGEMDPDMEMSTMEYPEMGMRPSMGMMSHMGYMPMGRYRPRGDPEDFDFPDPEMLEEMEMMEHMQMMDYVDMRRMRSFLTREKFRIFHEREKTPPESMDTTKFVELIKADNIDEFLIQLEKNPKILHYDRVQYTQMFENLLLLESCAYNGAEKIFMYLISEYPVKITHKCLDAAIYSGNSHIIKECFKRTKPTRMSMNVAIRIKKN
ncbi:hypothetical protein TVAG_204290 [Trichomonas vaginalis G3]|uniref:DUF3447 domain-containing protein n=1 Tax=Trichomonas vaginalis (strain ATCC PRA-98 / G3) TaxID=412133 RepID=A2FJ23_TRIV3|nr:protein of unknown function (DUF3447) [Trichomonas vaginalis G3]EAX95087.1 hypothetical protein TVAG_204290 [Trichomonas vaginalis G3]KAI5501923.1 protein of unknown function (DUF3447) [Trichomonas vaginalis G3]|eukprot:XP_001308017.1 hypothetical protein [Trichomonas vaginalis G3]